MFELAVQELAAILNRNSWVSELAGILPLSALIDFIDLPPKLHIIQLAGSALLWNSPITPAGSRLLLSDDRLMYSSCYLDRYGNSISLLGLDGRFGSRYYISNPETIRLWIRAHKPRIIDHVHENVDGHDRRVQNLEIVHVYRRKSHKRHRSSSYWLRRIFLQSPWMNFANYFGWTILFAMIVMSIILQTYLSLAFLILMPVTGSVVFALYGTNPRRLLVDVPGNFNRLILVAEHENTMDWIVFYGENTIINSLLNRPLKPQGPTRQTSQAVVLRMVLRVLILGQWALAIGAAAVKDWNAYFITFWIAFCIFMNAYVVPPQRGAKEWMKSHAGIQMERYRTRLSSRRTLLNTIIALNPDTFSLSPATKQEDRTKFHDDAMKWIDPILIPGPNRARWLEATLKAMNDVARQSPSDNEEKEKNCSGNFISKEWNEEYKRDYWAPFILEGICMAARIKEEANLPGRMVENAPQNVI
ncbi:hypothetical protein K449DRAFT_429349 [Hypoxylon sp. EC38]|nr:hypothetical protein K449DRAFT_429349 [Hypoxylon sp. EC38]